MPGVTWDKRRKKWRVQIRVDGKTKSFGSFPDEIAAARAYDAFVIAKKLNKPLNFPGGAAAKGHVVASWGTSRFRGVSWDKSSKKWVVSIRSGGKKKHIGSFADEVEAAHAYDAYAIANGIDMPRNFPNEDEDDVVAEARVRAASRKRKTSSYRGVSWHKARKKWQVFIRVDGKQKTIGSFSDEVEAAHAYDAYAIANGIDTPRNFPGEDEDDVVAGAERGRAAKKRKNAANKKWKVQISVDGKRKTIGRFADEVEAARAYDAYAIANGINVPHISPNEDEDELTAARAARAARERRERRWLWESPAAPAAPAAPVAPLLRASRYQGVWTSAGKWYTVIRVDGKTVRIGTFSDEMSAAQAYDEYVIANGIDTPHNFSVPADSVGEESRRNRMHSSMVQMMLQLRF